MNKNYYALMKAIGLPTELIDCARGRLRIPIASLESPAEWFGFPAAFCPIWSDASLHTYLGYWKHWFSTRPGCFVDMRIESGKKVREIARTVEQFFCYAVMDAVCANDNNATREVVVFADALRINNLDEIVQLSKTRADETISFQHLEQFSVDQPLICVSDVVSYDGTFPTGVFSKRRKWWEESTLFEISDEVVYSWPARTKRPIWFDENERLESFNDSLEKKDLHSAWMCLNSPGWFVPDACDAIERLAAKAKSDQFSLLAKAWKSVAKNRFESY